MRKIKVIISLCLISILFFLIYIFFESPTNITTFRRYTSPTYKINKSLIETLHKDDDVKQQVILSVLDIIEYDKWNEFLNYITINKYYGNIIPDSPQQLMLSLNLSKDSGVVVIFDEVGDNYIFRTKIDQLSPIESIKSIKHPTESNDFIAIYQVIDESLGAFFRENFVQIYRYEESNLNLVWEKTLFYEEIFKQNWINLESPDTDWTMVVEETEIDFNFTNSVKINTITSFKKYGAQSKIPPKKDDFLLKEEKSYSKPYYWNDEYKTFVLGKLTRDVFISDIAILDDMDNKQEWLFGIRNPYYRVSTIKEEIIYLPKSKFSKLFKSFSSINN